MLTTEAEMEGQAWPVTEQLTVAVETIQRDLYKKIAATGYTLDDFDITVELGDDPDARNMVTMKAVATLKWQETRP